MNKKAENYIKKSLKMAKDQERDVVMTPEWIAQDIIKHYNPYGFILDPCRGTGNFYNNFPTDLKDWCEITEGRDFFEYDKHADWIITNPPYGNMVPFLIQGMKVADNVVYYMYVDIFFTKARINIMQEMGFGLKEIYFIEARKEDDFPRFGRSLAAVHLMRGWQGDVKINKLEY